VRVKLEPTGQLLSGDNEVDIVIKMRALWVGPPAPPTALEKYMQMMVKHTKELAEIVVEGGIVLSCNYKNFNPKLEGSTEEQCKNFLAELAKNKLITILEP